MEFATLVIMLALTQYIFFVGKTGEFRGKYEVNAPTCTGDVNFECMFRIQQNTMEQLVIFIPCMLAFATYVSSVWVILPGVLFVIGRQLYSHLYVKNPQSRSPGFALSFFSNIALVIGSLIGFSLSLVG